MYHSILLSMDSETGARRRARLNWQPTERLVAVGGDEAPEALRRRTRMRYNTKASTVRGIVGCTWSHILALRRIVEGDLKHVLVLEDDARLVTPLPPIEALPQTSAVHLGGAICTPGTWVAKAKEFPEEVEAAVWQSLTPGLHLLQGFSIVGSEALYVPNAEVARRMLAVAEDPSLRMMHWDHFLRKHGLVEYLWAPNCFSSCDAEVSQIEGKVYLRDYYARGIRKIKKRQQQAVGFWPPRPEEEEDVAGRLYGLHRE
jgi:Glycosyltransferase family 25 (LPS biosynthesis protein)